MSNSKLISPENGRSPITILLFGETGAGKASTVNAFANYCKFSTFEEAENGQFLSLIPARFTLADPKTLQTIRLGNNLADENENHENVGSSVTQEPRKYEFELDGKLIRLIDTPGMGDTGGLEVDKENIIKIIDFVAREVDSIDAICFLIKTITTRKTAVFQYCLNEILTRLSPEACLSVNFLFTFSRNSFYGPGDGFETVRAFLDETHYIQTNMGLQNGLNCFFIDNEAYQYLLAKKYNYPFTEDIRESYRESWDKSVENINKLLVQINNRLKPLPVSSIFKKLNSLQTNQHTEIPIIENQDIPQPNLQPIDTTRIFIPTYPNEPNCHNSHKAWAIVAVILIIITIVYFSCR